MHEKVLSSDSLELLSVLESNSPDLFNGWILAGGTGLALQLGHRISDDFDFFRENIDDVRILHEELRKYRPYEILQETGQTLTLLAGGVKLSFFRAPAPFISDTVQYRNFRIAGITDIALMKLIAIHNRGSRKDFIDLYTILQGDFRLRDYFALLPKKYDPSTINLYSILKSLTYFEDAEREPAPRMLVPFRWEECKAFFLRVAHSIVIN